MKVKYEVMFAHDVRDETLVENGCYHGPNEKDFAVVVRIENGDIDEIVACIYACKYAYMIDEYQWVADELNSAYTLGRFHGKIEILRLDLPEKKKGV